MAQDFSGRIIPVLVSSESPNYSADEQCPLCERPGLMEQDHDHRSDLCRGRLCHSCNVLIGRYDRPIAEIQRFLEYLAFWADEHARVGGRSYTDYMRELVPHYGRGRGRRRKLAS